MKTYGYSIVGGKYGSITIEEIQAVIPQATKLEIDKFGNPVITVPDTLTPEEDSKLGRFMDSKIINEFSAAATDEEKFNILAKKVGLK